MMKITFRPERNFYGARRRQESVALQSAVTVLEARRFSPETTWFCNDCDFVPLSEIKREAEDSTTGVCKCGKPIDEIPF